jgi:hypothetical protein
VERRRQHLEALGPHLGIQRRFAEDRDQAAIAGQLAPEREPLGRGLLPGLDDARVDSAEIAPNDRQEFFDRGSARGHGAIVPRDRRRGPVLDNGIKRRRPGRIAGLVKLREFRPCPPIQGDPAC